MSYPRRTKKLTIAGLALIWGLSLPFEVALISRPVAIITAHGAVIILAPGATFDLRFKRSSDPWPLILPEWGSGSPHSMLALPLWIPLLGAVLIPSNERWRRRARCRECGYDLTGNVSGACPECGWAFGDRCDITLPDADLYEDHPPQEGSSQ